MTLSISTDQVRAVIDSLAAIHELAEAAEKVAASSSLGPGYSQVSGLDQLGARHGQVLVGSPGSAQETLQRYAEHLRWIGETLDVSLTAFISHNELLARAFDDFEHDHRNQTEEVRFPARPAFEARCYEFPSPSVGTPTSLKALVADFASTDTAAQQSATEQWRKLSKKADRITADLNRAHDTLQEHNEGESFSKATATIWWAADAAEALGRNTYLLSLALNRMGNAHRMGQEIAEGMLARVEEVEDPDDRRRLEEVYLAAFPATFSPMVQSAVPPMNSLMSLSTDYYLPGGAVAGVDDLSERKPVDFDELFKTGVKALAAQKKSGAAASNTMASVDAEMAAMNEVQHLAPTEVASLQAPATTLSNAAVPPAAPSAIGGVPGAGAGGGFGGGFGGAGGGGLLGGLQRFSQALGHIQGIAQGLGGFGNALNAGANTGFKGTAIGGVPAGNSAGARGGAHLDSSQWASTNAQRQAALNLPSLNASTGEGLSGNSHGARGLSGLGVPTTSEVPKTQLAGLSTPSSATAGSGMGASPLGAGGMGMGALNAHRSNHDLANLRGVGAAGGGVGGGVPGVGGVGSLGGVGGVGASQGAVPGTSGVGGAGSPMAAGSGMGRGAMSTGAMGGSGSTNSMMGTRPMMAMGQAGAHGENQSAKTKGKVKSVTSAVEEDSNTAALLGEREGVVPGVIGAWVRG